MRRFKKIMAAVLSGALIVGSVGVVPVVAEEATPVLLFREDFDEEVSLGADGLNFTGTTASGSNDYSQVIEEENGYLKLQGVGTSNDDKQDTSVEIPIENVPTNTTIWVEMDICAMVTVATSGVPQYTKVFTDATAIANMNQGKVTLEDESKVTILTKGVVSHLSYKIDLVNDKYYAYVGDSDEATYEGDYTKDSFEKLVIQMPAHKNNGTKYLQIDNLAVYASDVKVDVFAEPTKITLNNEAVTLEVGGTEQLVAKVETTGIAPTVTWTSGNESVATVSNDGVVEAVCPGTAVITAQAGTITATCTVTVDGYKILFKQDFDKEVSLGADGLNFTGTTASGSNDYSQVIEEENGYLKLQGVGTSNDDKQDTSVEIPIENVPTNTTIWVEMDICAMVTVSTSGVPQYTKILTDSTTIAYMKKGQVTMDESTVSILSKGKVSHLSYKIDLVNDKYYAYVGDSDEVAYEGSYTKDSFEKLVIQMPSHSANGSKYLQIDNLAVYASATKVDLFAEPTAITLNKTQITSMEVGSTEQLTAEVATTGIVPTVTWTSDDESVATVSKDGLVTAKKIGKTIITAKAGKIETTCIVIVGVTDILYKQDFETVSTYEELGYSTSPEGYTPNLIMENDNQYLAIQTMKESGPYIQIPFVNEYKDATVWIEMDVLADCPEDVERPHYIQVHAYGEKANKDYRVMLANMTALNVSPDGKVSSFKLSRTEWVRLSYKIQLSSDENVENTYTAYVDGVEAYTAEYTQESCQYLRIVLAQFTNNDNEKLKIDNVVTYVNEERIDFFAPEIKGTNLSLSGNIGVNFHADLGGYVGRECAYMQFTLPNGTEKEIKFSEADYNMETGYHVFGGEVSAKDMTGEIKVEMFAGNRQLIESVTFSVYGYAEEILTNAEYADAAPLVKALLNYGAYAQTYFDVNEDNLANNLLTETEKSVSNVTKDMIGDQVGKSIPDSAADLSFYGASLSLKSETALNYYFEFAGEDITAYTFMNGDTELEVKKSGNLYYVKKLDISAANLENMYSISVMKDDEEVMNVSYSALQYAYDVLNTTTDLTGKGDDKMAELQDVVRALYLYHVAAKTYVNSQSSSN